MAHAEGRTVKTITYGSYTIKSIPLQQLKTHDWKVNVSISWVQDGVIAMWRVTNGGVYPTEAGADVHGIIYGQQIIDKEITVSHPVTGSERPWGRNVHDSVRKEDIHTGHDSVVIRDWTSANSSSIGERSSI